MNSKRIKYNFWELKFSYSKLLSCIINELILKTKYDKRTNITATINITLNNNVKMQNRLITLLSTHSGNAFLKFIIIIKEKNKQQIRASKTIPKNFDFRIIECNCRN